MLTVTKMLELGFDIMIEKFSIKEQTVPLSVFSDKYINYKWEVITFKYSTLKFSRQFDSTIKQVRNNKNSTVLNKYFFT